jgi:polygalacturonase
MNVYNISFLNLIFLIIIGSASCKTAGDQNARTTKRDAILSKIVPPVIPEYSVSILSYGAKGDSVTNCKPAFDKAIAESKNHNGIKIKVPSGYYFIDGPIHLASNICIELEEGATLKFSSNPASYLPVVFTSWEGTLLHNYSPLIYGYQLENISIIGKGIIDGSGRDSISKWTSVQKTDQMLSRDMNHNNTPLKERVFGEGHYLRPQLMELFECKNILIEGITITNSPFWCIHLLKSENITIRGITYDAQNKNNDGIDPEYSKNILIENVNFNNADDNIAIKAGRDHEGRATAIPSENIIIRNCHFKGLHAVVIGSEMSAGVRNVFVENCNYAGYCKRGIYLKSNPDRGGFITDIFVNNLKFGEVEDCFFITSYYHGEGKGFSTDIYNIFIDSVSCKKATNAGIVVQGFPGKKVRDVYFSNVIIDSATIGMSLTNASNIVLNEVTIGGQVQIPSVAK